MTYPADKQSYIQIGWLGEADARRIVLDISELKALCPDSTWKLLYKRPEDELPYAAETTVDGNELTWHISSVDVAQTGRGSAQVLGVKSDSRTGADQVVVKGPVHTVRIEQSLIGETENPVHVWLELAQEAAQRAEGAALDARLSADDAAQSADLAAKSAENANTDAVAATNAAKSADTAADNAESSATQAQKSADAAGQSAAQAQKSAGAADQSAAQAQKSADAADQSAAQAQKSADEAAQSATQAQESANAAAQDAIKAERSATKAEQSATEAEQSATKAEDAAQKALGIIDDEVVAKDSTWSSMGIIEKLCPLFEVSGNVVQCGPVEGSPLDVTVEIVPTQEGTGDPSPENVRPIVGWDSVNVARADRNLVGRSSKNTWRANKSYWGVDLSGLTKLPMTLSIHLKDGASIPSNAYLGFIYGNNANDKMNAIWCIQSGSVQKTTYTYNNTNYVYVGLGVHPGTQETWQAIFDTCDIQLELSPTASDYEPYIGDTLTAVLGQTVYSGTLDITRGRFIITNEQVVFSGNEDWTLPTSLTEGYLRLWGHIMKDYQ